MNRSLFLSAIAVCLLGCGDSSEQQPSSGNGAVAPSEPQGQEQQSAGANGEPSADPSKSPSPGDSGRDAAGSIARTPFTFEEATVEGQQLFTRIAPERSKVDFVNEMDESHPLRRLYASAMVCGGVAVGDVDADGKPDLFFTNGPSQNRLFRQTGDLVFADITDKAGVSGGKAWGVGATMADADNDGDLDIYVCNHDGPNQFFINDGKGVFRDEAEARGVAISDASHTPAFCDYDRDGDLDFFLLTNRFYHPQGKLPPDTPVLDMSTPGKISVKPEYAKYIRITGVDPNTKQVHWSDTGRHDYLFKNDGKGNYTDATKAAGIESFGYGLSATWWDFNDDGYQDLYVGNDFNSPDYFYRNNGDGTFTDIVKNSVPHTTWFSMGADFGDLDEDGLPDFLIADMSGTNHYKQKTAMGAMSDSAEFLATAVPRQYMRNALYLNTGTSRFREAAYLTGLADTDWTWTVKLEDLDNDSRLDVFFTNGMSKNFNESDSKLALDFRDGETQWDRHVRAKTPELREQNVSYRNLGGLEFEDASKAWGLDHVGMSFGSVHTDLDQDGDLDLVVVNLAEPVSIYRNGSPRNRATVSLQGTHSNRRGVGARITLSAGGKEQEREVVIVRGYLASHEAKAHFGLGDAVAIDSLIVRWPSGHRQEFTNLEGNAHFVITEPNSKPPGTEKEATPDQPKLFEVQPILARGRSKDVPVRHIENPFDDFRLQPLLPNKMSQWGPGIALGDFNGDGREDLALGGSHKMPPQLCLAQGEGKYLVGRMTDDAHFEDMGLLLFEADGDGDLDLYVASGGSEVPPGHPSLRHRLYLNNGKGNFYSVNQAIPDIRDSASCVVAADFDRDGDLDLFVGGRFVPGAYPETPKSHLLRNDRGKFTDVTADVAPGLGETGLVTGAIFSDATGDGWVDLLVTHEWGAVKLFANHNGSKLIDQSSAAGLSERLGWWNGIAGADLDADGDTDYVVANFGLNTKYHAAAEKPALLYYGDFEQNGTKHLIEAEFEEDVLFPVRGRSCSSHAMPHLKEKFGTYHSFALASLQEIYTPKCLGESLRLECNELRSGVLINSGEGEFTFKPLPKIAQIAPVFGVAVTDANDDRKPDIVLGQNFYGPQVETGHMDGGVGQLLLGNGDGTFTAAPPSESGIIVPGDSTGVVLTDLNGDHRPDLIFARNNDSLSGFVSAKAHQDSQPLVIELKGPSGNPHGVGSRVIAHFKGGRSQSAEVFAGSGYLSQSSNKLYLTQESKAGLEKVDVHWADGNVKSYSDGLNGPVITLSP